MAIVTHPLEHTFSGILKVFHCVVCWTFYFLLKVSLHLFLPIMVKFLRNLAQSKRAIQAVAACVTLNKATVGISSFE